MTKYNQEDFKHWLNEKPERKENLDWESFFAYIVDEYFDAFIENRAYREQELSNNPNSGLHHYYQVAQKWLREKERETTKLIWQKTPVKNLKIG